jgi:hypothetical protein
MFSTPHVGLTIHSAKLRIGSNSNGDVTKEAEITLVCEPFPYHLAQELGDSVAGHLFTREKEPAVRVELESIQLDPRVPAQRVFVFADTRGEVAIGMLQQVAFGALKVTKVVNEKSGMVWLKASITATVDLGWREHRDWLIANFGEIRFFSFACEQEELLPDAGVRGAVRNIQRTLKRHGATAEMTGPDGEGVKLDGDTVTPIGRKRGQAVN